MELTASSAWSANPVLVAPEALLSWIHDYGRGAGSAPVRFLDVRWRLGAGSGVGRFTDGHIPGALFVDLERDLTDPDATDQGRHPLPRPEIFRACLSRWGLLDPEPPPVVVYDDTGGLSASRLWWLLRDYGFGEVRLLDGGWQGWVGAGGGTEEGSPPVSEAAGAVESPHPSPGHMPVTWLTPDVSTEAVVLDVRAGERYRGEVEPVDPRPGRIPGALNLPTAANLGHDDRFLPADRLRERFAGLAGDPVVYCGSGITAAHTIAALASVGRSASLYPGSYSHWSADPSRPVALGGEPGGDQVPSEWFTRPK